VRRAAFVRRIALATMVIVTAWSLWAWAQPEHAEESGPAPMNWTQFGVETPPYIAMLINFGILIGGYYLLGKKPIAAGLQHRRDTIAKDIDEAQRMKEEAEARAKTYQAKLDRVEEEARMAREDLLRTGEAERERLVRDAQAKAERMRRDAEFLVQQELKQIRLDLMRDTVKAAVTAAAELLAARVTSEDQERLAEAYLDELAGSTPAAATAHAGAATETRENAP
jgi:F-type H+-transporting ATPase subunit b